MEDLSVILVNYKTPGLLKQCIKSILKQTQGDNLKYKIIVIDNNSKDGSAEMIKEDFINEGINNVVLIANKKNMGFPKAVNQGIKEAGNSRYILILNPDITVLNHAIVKMIDFLDKHLEVAIVSAKLIQPNGTIQNSCRKFFTPKTVLCRRTFLGKLPYGKGLIKEFLMEDWDHKNTREVDWVLGSCMMIRKKAIDQVGVMDERFFMYMEDVDWCRRFWRAGWKVIYFPEAEMVHYYQRSSSTESGLLLGIFNKQARIHVKSAFKYFIKYIGKD